MSSRSGDANSSIEELQHCSADHPVTLYLNALIRKEESIQITSLADVREGTEKRKKKKNYFLFLIHTQTGVSFWSSSGHKVSRESKYTVGLAASPTDVRIIRIPPRDLVNDDFNAISDYFFFGTAE